MVKIAIGIFIGSRRLTHVTVLSQTPPQSQRVLANDFGTYGLELSYAIPRPRSY